MRWMLVSLLLIPAALPGKVQPANAQAAVAAYPWCLQQFSAGGRRVCYYSSYEQCRYEIREIGGVCVPSPYYHGGGGYRVGQEAPYYRGPEVLGPGAPYYRGSEGPSYGGETPYYRGREASDAPVDRTHHRARRHLRY